MCYCIDLVFTNYWNINSYNLILHFMSQIYILPHQHISLNQLSSQKKDFSYRKKFIIEGTAMLSRIGNSFPLALNCNYLITDRCNGPS